MKQTRISKTFSRLKASGKKAFIPYIMAGDPDIGRTRQYISLLEECGADIIELGVPFSDPLADGPTIQMAAERAVAAGVTLRKVISFVREVRTQTEIPLILMTYYNPVFKYGEEKFVSDAVDAGVDGVIIPDLPPDEAGRLIKLSRAAGLDTIFLIAPTSNDKRIKKVASASSGFLYYVSMTGITGTKLTLEASFLDHINKVKQASKAPVAVGFGVSTPDDARTIAGVADGVIVGSAIVKKLHEDPEGARDFIKHLREAVA
ncbi:MAG: tryptophan synthase subunit alpha [Nitrospirae bacterium]|nr:MAG: tryptophan synthase subunit alpha [Nitrospirota bacterium]